MRCVHACPVKALGEEGYPEGLTDKKACATRSEALSTRYLSPCGLCIRICPVELTGRSMPGKTRRFTMMRMGAIAYITRHGTMYGRTAGDKNPWSMHKFFTTVSGYSALCLQGHVLPVSHYRQCRQGNKSCPVVLG